MQMTVAKFSVLQAAQYWALVTRVNGCPGRPGVRCTLWHVRPGVSCSGAWARPSPPWSQLCWASLGPLNLVGWEEHRTSKEEPSLMVRI